MADTLTPEEKKRLTEELTKYANEGASDDDLRQFRDAFISELKKKGGTQPVSGQPVQQPGQPSAPSFGQKITEKITNASVQVPFRTTQQMEQPVEEKKKAAPSKYLEVDITEPQDVTSVAPEISPVEMEKRQAISMATPQKIAERENKQRAENDFYTNVASKEVFKMPTYFESKEYASDITGDYLNYLQQIDPEKGTYNNEKYKILKAKSKEDRTAIDESFLRQVESEAINKVYDANYERLQLLGSNIDNLEKIAVTPSDRSKLDYMYKEYEKVSNSLQGLSATYDQNNLQYGKIAGQEMQSEEDKRKRFEAIQAGEGKTKEFFTAVGDAAMDGILNIYQFPKVMGDLTGDKDYDWSDEFYDSISGAKSALDVDLGAPLPKGAKMSDLPIAARAAVVGGNAIGTMGIFALGGATGGATKLGQRAATFATSFLTQESNYYQEALDGGMSPQDAAITGTYLAAQMALFETIMPDIGYLNATGFKKGVISGAMQAMRSGLPTKEAAKLAFKNALSALPENALIVGKNVLKSGGKETILEEFPQNLAEDTAKEIINSRSQKAYFNDTFNPDNYVDAAIGSFIAAGGISGGSSLFSKATPKSPVQREVMRHIVENRDKIFEKGTAADKIAGTEGKKEVDEAGEILDAMKSHSVWGEMPKEKQDQAFALAQQAAIMKKEQERMKKLRIPDEQKDAEIKRLEDEVNMMFAEQLEQQKQAIYDQENIQGVPGEVGVGQELVEGQPIQGAGQEATTAGGVLEKEEKVITPTLSVGSKIQWNVYGNEESGEWTVGEKTKTRGGEDAVVLSKTYVESSRDGKSYTKEYADANGIKYDNERIVEHTVPISELQTQEEAIQTTEAALTRISEINNLEQALFENEVSQNETGAGTLSEQQLTDITAKLDEMRGQNKEGGLNEIETLMKQALGENLITAADIDKMVEDGNVEIKCPPGAKKAEHGMRIGFIPGGKWDIVTEFKGKSHENGGIDIEIAGGKINYTSKEPNLKAKKGGFWKTLKDIGLGIVDTQLSTIGNVAGIKSMQDIIDEDQYSNDKFDEAGNFVGKLAGTALKVIPVTAPIASAVGMAGGAINQIAGIDAKNYDPSQHTSKLSQVGDVISAAGTIAGMAVNAGTAASASKTFAAGDKLSAAQKMSMQMGGINRTLGQVSKGVGMIGGGVPQQQPQQFLQQTQSNPALLPQQTMANPYQQPQYGMPVQQTYSNNRSNVVTINGVNYAPDQYGNLIPLT